MKSLLLLYSFTQTTTLTFPLPGPVPIPPKGRGLDRSRKGFVSLVGRILVAPFTAAREL